MFFILVFLSTYRTVFYCTFYCFFRLYLFYLLRNVTYRLLNNIYIALLFIFFFIYLSYHLLNNTYIALLLIFLFAYHTVYLLILTLSCLYLHCFFSLLSTYRTVFWIIPTSFFYLISPLSNKLSYGFLNITSMTTGYYPGTFHPYSPNYRLFLVLPFAGFLSLR